MGALLVLFLLLASPPPAQAQAPAGGPESGTEAVLRAVSAFSPRQEGSPAESALLDWIAAREARQGMRSAPFDFRNSDFEHSFARCLRVDVPGRSKDTLVIAVPVDAAPDTGPARDGSVGVALAVDLLDHLQGTVPPLSLVVLFLGAELGGAEPYPMGSTLFLRNYQPDYRTAVLYLDLRAMPHRIRVRGGGRGIVSPFWLMKRSMDSLERTRVPFQLQAEEMLAFRLAVIDERTLIEPWLRAGYPAVGLEGEYGEGNAAPANDLLPALSSFLTSFVASGREGIPEEWDRHYLLVQAGGTPLIVGETAYVTILGGTFAVMLLAAFILVRRLRKYVRTLVRNIGAIVPLAALAVAFLVAGTFAARAIPAARGFDGLWTYAPLEFLGLKVCVALFLYAALYNPLRLLPFPRNGSFYSAAALLFLLLETAVVAVFDISFAAYFLWAFLFVFFATLARNRWLKLALALPAPLLGLRGIISLFLLPALRLCHVIALSPILGNLMVAGAALPFILLVVRLGLLFKGRGVMRRGTRELVAAGVLAAAGGALAVHLFVFSPFSPAHPQPLVATQTVVVDPVGRTSSTTLGIESPAPVRGISLSTSDGTVSLPSGKVRGPVALSLVESPVQVSVQSGRFLQQLNLGIEVRMPTRPRSFTLSVDSGQDFVLYDSSFPALRVGPRSYRLLVGAFPPDPFSVQLSLPVDQAFTLTIAAEFDAPLIGVDVKAQPDARVATRVRVVRTLEVKT
jgi:hypothetical protein